MIVEAEEKQNTLFLPLKKWLDHLKIQFLKLLSQIEMLMGSLDTNLSN